MTPPIKDHFDRYVSTFATRDPGRIVQLHTPDSTYWQRTDTAPVVGREAIAQAFGDLFAQWPDLTCVVRDTSFGSDFWVLDWTLDTQGRRGRVRFDCLDVVHVDGSGLVESKRTFVDLAQAQAALARDSRPAA